MFLAVCLVCSAASAVRAEITDRLFNVATVVPGMTKTVEVHQKSLFPLGCPQFFIIVLGEGTLGLSLIKDDVSGDMLYMSGAAYTGDRIEPIARVGVSKGMIAQIIESSGGGSSAWIVWLSCGVIWSVNNPTYMYDIRISFSP